ncbi:hypothetical protein [Nocardia sp. NPDC052566]|uniref:hypothetical protein n=1 Tax=Nocardia sp. NPDC052566 TaxID=3364330 RepID=UPI0037C82F76
MLFTKFATVSVLLLAALEVTGGNAVAAPPAAPVHFTARTADSSAIITTDAGSMVVEDGNLEIKDDDGTLLTGTPLRFRVDDFEFPIAADISGNTATLTPQYDMAHATYRPAALPFQDKAPWKSEYDREKDAFSRMTTTIALGASVGALVGGLGGATVGCVLGGLGGAAVASATLIGLLGPFLPAALVGCVAGVIALGSLGTLTGTLVVGIPVAIAAVVQYYTTINEPFVPPAK